MCISQVLTAVFLFMDGRDSGGGLCGRKCPSILNGFGEVSHGGRIGRREVGDRARHFQNAVIRPCRPAETFTGFPEQALSGGIELADGVHFAAVQLTIRLALPFELPVARVSDTARNDRAGFANGCSSPRQFRRRQCGQFDLDIDAIKQRPGQFAQITRGDVGRAAASAVWITAPAARAGIHGCDQLTRRWKIGLMRCARNSDAAGLQRFA